MRLLAVDYGKVRVGVAITDPGGVISQPLETLRNKSDKKVIQRLKYLVKENDIGVVLVGNPLAMDGHATAMSEHIQRFAKKLQKALTVEVKLWDERFTSEYAKTKLQEMGIRKDSKRIDQIVACIILDEYLSTRTRCST